MKTSNDESDEIWRDELKEHRGSYYVTYQPADSRWNFATIGLVFPEPNPDLGEVRGLMEQEMKLWLARFPVPVMVSSFDATESVIQLPKEDGGSHLMGYTDLRTGKIVHRWGTFRSDEMPATETTAEHFDRVYFNIPFQRAKAVREAAELERRKLRAGFRVWKTVFILVAVIPLAIELVSLGIGWLNNILLAISIATGLYKVAKAADWIKESRSKKEEAEKQRIKDHYYYHCERNQEGFERLKSENFRREMEERTRKQAAELKKAMSIATPAIIGGAPHPIIDPPHAS